MTQVILFNKPFHVLCQFSPHEGKTTLGKFIDVEDYYPCGRLDFDSEGLLILSNNGSLQSLISQPKHKLTKTYLVQVEGAIGDNDLAHLASGVELKDGRTLPAEARRVETPRWLWDRNPPIRERKQIPTSWIELTIREGKNRQVRRMTAATGHPTLRLIRTRIGPWTLSDISPGTWSYANLPPELARKLNRLEIQKRKKTSPNARGRHRRRL